MNARCDVRNFIFISILKAELERIIWCCKAASIPSPSRMRILGALSSILFSRDRTFSTDSPAILQTLLQALLSVKYSLFTSSSAGAEIQSIAGYIAEVQAGKCGELSRALVEKEFGVRFSGTDNEVVVREAVITESVVNCVELGSVGARRWALRTLPEVCKVGIRLNRR